MHTTLASSSLLRATQQTLMRETSMLPHYDMPLESFSVARFRVRRCFAFFHPSMPEEPLIFVEVALTADIPRAIEPVLQIDREAMPAHEAGTAVFYSISNCQAGLAGISFGNFLIKRVAQELKQEFPELKRFVTLSPVPGLMKWLADAEPDLADRIAGADAGFWNGEAATLEKPFLAAALRSAG